MKYIISLILFSSIAFSQYTPLYQAGTVLPTSIGNMQFFYKTLDSTLWQDRGNFGWVCVDGTPRAYTSSSSWSGKIDSARAIALFNLKQNVIPNLANTSKYLETTQVKNGAYWDTTRLAWGTVTIPKGDSIQVTITGTSSSSVVTTAYQGKQMVCDTVASWIIPAVGKITIYGKYNKVVGYHVIK